jgi:hypothetical protein
MMAPFLPYALDLVVNAWNLVCRHNKIRVLLGGWWRKEARPPPAKLFYAYSELPEESREFLERCELFSLPCKLMRMLNLRRLLR